MEKKIAMSLPEEKQHYTYADYYGWDDGERWELIEGVSYLMSPAPFQKHQEVLGKLYLQFADFLKGKPCKVFIAPFDVRLNPETGDDTVVRPDLLIICDRSKLDGKCCVGAPDMTIEILSPSSERHDRFVKFHAYQNAGVREYWIVDPNTRTIQVCILENGKYVVTMYGDNDAVPVHVLDGCVIDTQAVFEE